MKYILLVVCIVSSGLSIAQELTNKDIQSFKNLENISGVNLELTTEEKKASFGLNYQVFTDSFDYIYFDAVLTGVIDDSGGTLANRHGLAGDSELQVSLTKLLLNQNYMPLTEDEANVLEKSQNELNECKKSLSAKDDYKVKCDVQLRAFNTASKVGNTSNLFNKYKFFKLGVKSFKNKFEYFYIDELKKYSSSEDGYELGFRFGGMLTARALKWELGADYQNGYSYGDGNPVKNICTPINQSDSTECRSIRVGAPVKIEGVVPLFSISIQPGADKIVKAAALEISYLNLEEESLGGSIEKNSKIAIDVPIYIFMTDKNQYRGGVKLSWVSKAPEDADKFAIGIFYSQPFNIFD